MTKTLVNKPSPITGGKLELWTVDDIATFRNEKFSYERSFYHCVDSGAEFADAEMEEANLKRIYDAYRRRHNIPLAEELVAMRQRYGLSQRIISNILGLGDNQYGLYEDGTVPSLSIGRILSLAMNADVFRDLIVQARASLSPEDYRKSIVNVERFCSGPGLVSETSVYNQFEVFDSSFPSSAHIKVSGKKKLVTEPYLNDFPYACC